MHWHLILEEYGPKLLYVKGEKNLVADALGRLPIATDNTDMDISDLYYLADHFGLEDSDLLDDIYPLHYQLIQKYQKTDKPLLKKFKQKAPNYHLQSFRGSGKTRNLICYKDKIVIPTALQNRVVSWYHTMMLCHAGETRTEQTVRQQFWWPI
jgi:Integrase zinc binding domain